VSYLQSHRSGKSLTMWTQAHTGTSGCNNGNDRRHNKPYLDESACAAVDFAAGDHFHGVEQGLTWVKWVTLGLARVRLLFSQSAHGYQGRAFAAPWRPKPRSYRSDREMRSCGGEL